MLYSFTSSFITDLEQEFTAKVEYFVLFCNIVIDIFILKLQL